MDKVFHNKDGRQVLLRMVKAIQANKDYLGKVDGLIGDGDHGMNMNKGFSLFGERLGGQEISFKDGLNTLGLILLEEIGGSMGPIYGTMFLSMAEAVGDKSDLGVSDLEDMMDAAVSGLQEIIEAKVGDKTLMDTFIPAVRALHEAAGRGAGFEAALEAMKSAAEAGMNTTKDMVARYGRSSRLGERSRGVLDAGAVSCCLLLESMADGMTEVPE